MSKAFILDPLWITKGSSNVDFEYLKYVMLAANKKWRKELEDDSISSFYEILFHTLNLNNLAMDGSMLDCNLNPVWDDPKLKEIRDGLREIYNLPDEISSIFKNANYIFVSMMLDYLKHILKIIDGIDLNYINDTIHNEKEIYMILRKSDDNTLDLWKLRYDKRFKNCYKLELIDKISSLNAIKENELDDSAIITLTKLDNTKNVLIASTRNEHDTSKLAEIISFSLIFSRIVMKDVNFQPDILQELYDLLSKEKILPFRLSSWT